MRIGKKNIVTQLFSSPNMMDRMLLKFRIMTSEAITFFILEDIENVVQR